MASQHAVVYAGHSYYCKDFSWRFYRNGRAPEPEPCYEEHPNALQKGRLHDVTERFFTQTLA